uniref:Retrovirus-related Pol polyprotein from transposon TNT 1-94-like beta-barrel domain-containing protein n=1 Tax=Cannabis sativa TaxID=3483 RepID=A0A803PXI5_CANSA
MLFCLTMNKVAFVLTTLKPFVPEPFTDKEKEAEREKQQKEFDSWVENNFLCASCHICDDHAMFQTYTTTDDKKVLLEDSHTTIVAGIGNVELKFTLGKTFIIAKRCNEYS